MRMYAAFYSAVVLRACLLMESSGSLSSSSVRGFIEGLGMRLSPPYRPVSDIHLMSPSGVRYLFRADLTTYQVAIAAVSHLFPFRTEQLSPLAPMVLHSNAGE